MSFCVQIAQILFFASPEKFGQGDLPVNDYTPGEAEDNVADISIMASIGWMPTISVLDSV